MQFKNSICLEKEEEEEEERRGKKNGGEEEEREERGKGRKERRENVIRDVEIKVSVVFLGNSEDSRTQDVY